LFLEPLPGYIGVSSQSPVVVVVAHEHIDVPADEHKDQVDEAPVHLVRCLHAHELHASENLIQT